MTDHVVSNHVDVHFAFNVDCELPLLELGGFWELFEQCCKRFTTEDVTSWFKSMVIWNLICDVDDFI